MPIEHSYRWQGVADSSGLKRVRKRRVVDENFVLPGAIETNLVLVYVHRHTEIEAPCAATDDRGAAKSVRESHTGSEVVVVRQVRLNVKPGTHHQRQPWSDLPIILVEE